MWPTPAAEGHNLETYPPTLVTQNDATMTTKRGDELKKKKNPPVQQFKDLSLG